MAFIDDIRDWVKRGLAAADEKEDESAFGSLFDTASELQTALRASADEAFQKRVTAEIKAIEAGTAIVTQEMADEFCFARISADPKPENCLSILGYIFIHGSPAVVSSTLDLLATWKAHGVVMSDLLRRKDPYL